MAVINCPHCDRNFEIPEYEEVKEPCPYIKRLKAKDETWSYCNLSERPSGRIKTCLLESGQECEEYKMFLKEIT